MKRIIYIFNRVLILTLCNCIALWKLTDLAVGAKIGILCALICFYLLYIVRAGSNKADDKKLCRLAKGAYLVNGAVTDLLLNTFVIAAIAVFFDLNVWRQVGNGLLGYGLIALIAFAGIIRTVMSAKQVKILHYVLLLFMWYIPIVNLFILQKIAKTARKEFFFEQSKLELDDMRKENEVCKTKYPILMVHGIFFRDWQKFNYWGRIPKELVRNGAEVFYGNQQSSAHISRSAEELKKSILKVINDTGAEKVNIIAHSKGGLDSRYAISKLGMDKYVASLTTINTPHYGAKFVDKILAKVSDNLMDFVAKKYNRLFSALGDSEPDFKAGVTDLSYAVCSKFDEELPDSPDIYYYSVMSTMKNVFSAGFPLNLGYMLNKPHGTGNDGLVTVESALRGENTYLIEHKEKRGISHGDMIDLFRENIDGFDVREFYVNIVKGLKDKGF